MRQTSIDIYNQIESGGLLSYLRFEVYKAFFYNGPMTQGEMWKRCFPERQRHDVAPRVAELVSRSVLAYVGERMCEVTGRVCMVFDVTSNLPKEPPKKITNKEKIKHLEKRILELESYILIIKGQGQFTFGSV
jgi:hypothetical protein